MAKWSLIINLVNLFNVFVFISSVCRCLLSVCFSETVAKTFAVLFDIDDALGVNIFSFCFCPPTAGDFSLAT